MIDRITNLAAQQAAKGGGVSSSSAPSTSFADTLKSHMDEVNQLQQDASKAVENLSTGKTGDVTGVFVAVEKSDAAFKTLLAIRSKLLDAYDEIKNMPV